MRNSALDPVRYPAAATILAVLVPVDNERAKVHPVSFRADCIHVDCGMVVRGFVPAFDRNLPRNNRRRQT